jgi:hypothetical protein
LIASEKLARVLPDDVDLTSASCPAFPMRITLLTPMVDMVLSSISDFEWIFNKSPLLQRRKVSFGARVFSEAQMRQGPAVTRLPEKRLVDHPLPGQCVFALPFVSNVLWR